MSSSLSPETNKRRFTQGLTSKVAAEKRAGWDDGTRTSGEAVWSVLDSPQEFGGPQFAASSRPHSRMLASRDGPRDEDAGAGKEAGPSRFRASADLSPYMKASPYISKIPSSTYARALSKPSSHSRLSVGVRAGAADSDSRPTTQARPRTQGPSGRKAGGSPAARPSSQPAGFSPAARGARPSAAPATERRTSLGANSQQPPRANGGRYPADALAAAAPPSLSSSRSLNQPAGYPGIPSHEAPTEPPRTPAPSAATEAARAAAPGQPRAPRHDPPSRSGGDALGRPSASASERFLAAAPGAGHRAAAFAVSGLGIGSESRPTTQELRTAQREQLGFGTRPTTQERQQLASRAGPRRQPGIAPAGGSRGDSRGNPIPEAHGGRPPRAPSRGSEHFWRDQAARSSVPVIAENPDGEAYGMTLGDYLSQMKTETWSASGGSRPQSGVSATMTDEDCVPPLGSSLLSDCSEYSCVDSELSDSDASEPFPGGSGDDQDLSSIDSDGGEAHDKDGCAFAFAVENGYDLRPATAAPNGMYDFSGARAGDDPGSTKEVDLASLPAALFHPRGEDGSHRPEGSGRSNSVWRQGSSSGRSRGSCRGDPPDSPVGADPRAAPRQTQSARPGCPDAARCPDGDTARPGWDGDGGLMAARPPSRQRPPPEALHLFNAFGHGGTLRPSLVSNNAGASLHRPRTTSGPSRPLSGPQLRLKSDGSGFASATHQERAAAVGLTRPPSRQRGPALSALRRDNAAEDFPEPPPKGHGKYDLDIMGADGDDSD